MAATTKSIDLVLQAEQRRTKRFAESVSASLRKSVAMDSAEEILFAYNPWARALNDANLHITVRPEEIEEAANAYIEVGKILVEKLHWPDDSIKILTQGSVSTKTLIRSPNSSKFDIDAVCRVDVSRIDARYPMAFFDNIGRALEHLEAIERKRCWTLLYTNKPFYLDVTPSVPLDKVPQLLLESMAPKYHVVPEYRSTALAVVDRPTRRWKTSNPLGMTKWVDDASKMSLLRNMVMDAVMQKATAGIAPVPDQEVEISDTLRAAIRLFKRHRDMSVRKNIIDDEFKPISIIIVTLLTQCYRGLAELGRSFDHPVEVLLELATLMPLLVLHIGGEYYVGNPTVEGENFAEKWNADSGKRSEAFDLWCKVLISDMETIMGVKDPQEIAKQVRTVFGIPATTGTSGGGGPTVITRRPPPPVAQTPGLA